MSGGHRVAPELAGQRLDRIVAAAAGVARNQARSWIDAGHVTIDGRVETRASRAVREGESLAWDPPPPPDPRIVAESGELAVLHVDEAIIVLDKPPGLAMHPGAGRSTATLAHRLLGAFPELAGVGGPGRPGIVHRLDRDTSGGVVVARTAAAYESLSRAFARREVSKQYLAIVRGAPSPASGRVEAPIARHAVRRKEMAVRAGGRPALTLYRTLAVSPKARNRPVYALLELDLKTGRTHQIRVHLKHVGHPIAGDPTYGAGDASGAPRLALHAWRLALRHPLSGEVVEFRTPLRDDLASFWTRLAGTAPPLD